MLKTLKSLVNCGNIGCKTTKPSDNSDWDHKKKYNSERQEKKTVWTIKKDMYMYTNTKTLFRFGTIDNGQQKLW